MKHPLPFQPVSMADDEQSVTVGGHKFVAQVGEPGRCLGCAFPDGFGCALWREDQSPRCQSKDRRDGVGIVWVPAVRATK